MLVPVLADTFHCVQEAAQAALVEIDPAWPKSPEAREAVPELLLWLDKLISSRRSKSDKDYAMAVTALHQIGSEVALRGLAQRLERLPLDNVDATVQVAIARYVVVCGADNGEMLGRNNLHRAISILGKTHDPESIGPLARHLSHPDAEVRGEVHKALRHVHEDWRGTETAQATFNTHLALFGDPDYKKRAAGASALGHLGNPRATEALIPLLLDQNDEVREEAARALGYIGDIRAADALLAATTHTNTKFREYACESLGLIVRKVRDPIRIQYLIEAIRQRGLVKLAEDIADSGHRSAITVLVEWLPHYGGDYSHWDPLKKPTWHPLEKVDSSWAQSSEAKAAVPTLIAQLGRSGFSEEDKAGAARVLAQLGDQRAIPALAELMEDPSCGLRAKLECAIALASLNDNRGLAGLRLLWDSPNPHLGVDWRVRLAVMLARLGDKRGVMALLRMLGDKSDKAWNGSRTAAASALGSLGESGAVPLLTKAIQERNPYQIEIMVAALTEVLQRSAIHVADANLVNLLKLPQTIFASHSDFDWDRMEYDRPSEATVSLRQIRELVEEELGRRRSGQRAS